jgi:mannosyltransferase
MTETKESIFTFTVIGILAFGSILRIYNLGFQSLWFDEIASISMASNIDHLKVDFHPPFYFYLLRYWMYWFGSSEISVRGLSNVLGITSLFFILKTGSRFLSSRGLIFLSVLVSFSLTHIWFSQEARAYILLFLLATISLLVFFHWLQHPTHPTRIALLWFVNILLIYTHYGVVPFLMTQACVVELASRSKRFFSTSTPLKPYLLVVLIVLIGFLPWVPFFLEQLQNAQHNLWTPAPTSRDIFFLPGRLLFYLPEKFGWYSNFLLLVLLTLSIAYYATTTLNPFRLLACFAVLPPLFAFTLSQMGQQLFIAKVLITTTPALLIVLAAFLDRLKLFGVAILAVYLTANVSLYNNYYQHKHKENWRELAIFLEENQKTYDTYYFTAPGTQLALQHYLKLDATKLSTTLSEPVAANQQLWVIVSMTPTPLKIIKEECLAKRWKVSAVKRFAGIKLLQLQGD